mmetsp:Transcript_4539/g.14899  ORF Transcript_4539/g.14899 Transcript_4539/m.14899 type:complete len:235 (+) Transcript_4539:719-1423(+)
MAHRGGAGYGGALPARAGRRRMVPASGGAGSGQVQAASDRRAVQAQGRIGPQPISGRRRCSRAVRRPPLAGRAHSVRHTGAAILVTRGVADFGRARQERGGGGGTPEQPAVQLYPAGLLLHSCGVVCPPLGAAVLRVGAKATGRRGGGGQRRLHRRAPPRALPPVHACRALSPASLRTAHPQLRPRRVVPRSRLHPGDSHSRRRLSPGCTARRLRSRPQRRLRGLYVLRLRSCR